jgi:hypothetical protein
LLPLAIRHQNKLGSKGKLDGSGYWNSSDVGVIPKHIADFDKSNDLLIWITSNMKMPIPVPSSLPCQAASSSTAAQYVKGAFSIAIVSIITTLVT